MTRQQTINILRACREQMHREFGVRSLSLYGSVARDEAVDSSDVDVLVEFDRPAGYFQLERLERFLEGLLGCKVDVNTPASLRDTIRQQVAAEAIHVD